MLEERYSIPKEKIKQVENILHKKKIDSLLLFAREGSDANVPFLTGAETIHLAAIFINRNKKHIVITSESDMGKYKESGIFDEVIMYEASIKDDFLKVLKKLSPNKLALNISEEDNLCDGLTVGLYLILEDMIGKERLREIETSSEDILKEVRSIKTKTEIERIKKAVVITNDIYDEVFQKVQCGMTEKEISEIFIEEMKKRNVTSGIGDSYDPPIVCLVRAGLAHRKPGETKSESGDILIMDFSVKYKGYVSDIARTAYFLRKNETKPPEDVQKAFETAYNAITETINYISAGKKGFEVDAVGRKVIEDGGYPTVRHSVGHQIGKECHDGGTILGPKKKTKRPAVEGIIKPGELYAIEPTVIQDNNLPCMLVEENILVNNNSIEILSRRQKELYLIKC